MRRPEKLKKPLAIGAIAAIGATGLFLSQNKNKETYYSSLLEEVEKAQVDWGNTSTGNEPQDGVSTMKVLPGGQKILIQEFTTKSVDRDRVPDPSLVEQLFIGVYPPGTDLRNSSAKPEVSYLVENYLSTDPSLQADASYIHINHPIYVENLPAYDIQTKGASTVEITPDGTRNIYTDNLRLTEAVLTKIRNQINEIINAANNSNNLPTLPEVHIYKQSSAA